MTDIPYKLPETLISYGPVGVAFLILILALGFLFVQLVSSHKARFADGEKAAASLATISKETTIALANATATSALTGAALAALRDTERDRLSAAASQTAAIEALKEEVEAIKHRLDERADRVEGRQEKILDKADGIAPPIIKRVEEGTAQIIDKLERLPPQRAR